LKKKSKNNIYSPIYFGELERSRKGRYSPIHIIKEHKKISAVAIVLLLLSSAFVPYMLHSQTVVGGDGDVGEPLGGDIPLSDDPGDTVVTGLTFEDVDIFWTDTGATLSNSYTDIALTAKQVFVPDELDDKTEHFEYFLQEWHDTKARFWVTLTYLQYTHADYGDLNLNNLLGNLPQQEPVNLSSAVNFTIWNGANSVLYNVQFIIIMDFRLTCLSIGN